jgi:hypothetical protein
MSRPLLFLVLLLLALGMSDVSSAQTKKGSAPGRNPTAKDHRSSVSVYMRDAARRSSRGHAHLARISEYNAVALARYFAVMKALEPTFVQDDDVAYTWGTKGKVTKCSIYLESWEANARAAQARWWWRQMASAMLR